MDKQNSLVNRCFNRSFPTAIRMVMVMFLAMTFSVLLAQEPTVNQKEPGAANFYELQKQFYDYWGDRPVPKAAVTSLTNAGSGSGSNGWMAKATFPLMILL